MCLSSFTQYYWIKLSLIVQYSSLLAKSLGLISVPVWLTVLSNQLKIISLVSYYPTNNLIFHKPIFKQFLTLNNILYCRCKNILVKIRLYKTWRQVLMYYSPVRHVKNIRLACVKYTTSVHSEPGSNSLYLLKLNK